MAQSADLSRRLPGGQKNAGAPCEFNPRAKGTSRLQQTYLLPVLGWCPGARTFGIAGPSYRTLDRGRAGL